MLLMWDDGSAVVESRNRTSSKPSGALTLVAEEDAAKLEAGKRGVSSSDDRTNSTMGSVREKICCDGAAR